MLFSCFSMRLCSSRSSSVVVFSSSLLYVLTCCRCTFLSSLFHEFNREQFPDMSQKKDFFPTPPPCASFLVCCYYVSGDFGAMNWNRASALGCLGKDMFLFHGFLLLWSIVSGVIDESSDSLTSICQQKGSIDVTILRLVTQSSALLWFDC